MGRDGVRESLRENLLEMGLWSGDHPELLVTILLIAGLIAGGLVKKNANLYLLGGLGGLGRGFGHGRGCGHVGHVGLGSNGPVLCSSDKIEIDILILSVSIVRFCYYAFFVFSVW
jgi:hypothetical protein